jgi:hypothetical protein
MVRRWVLRSCPRATDPSHVSPARRPYSAGVDGGAHGPPPSGRWSGVMVRRWVTRSCPRVRVPPARGVRRVAEKYGPDGIERACTPCASSEHASERGRPTLALARRAARAAHPSLISGPFMMLQRGMAITLRSRAGQPGVPRSTLRAGSSETMSIQTMSPAASAAFAHAIRRNRSRRIATSKARAPREEPSRRRSPDRP